MRANRRLVAAFLIGFSFSLAEEKTPDLPDGLKYNAEPVAYGYRVRLRLPLLAEKTVVEVLSPDPRLQAGVTSKTFPGGASGGEVLGLEIAVQASNAAAAMRPGDYVFLVRVKEKKYNYPITVTVPAVTLTLPATLDLAGECLSMSLLTTPADCSLSNPAAEIELPTMSGTRQTDGRLSFDFSTPKILKVCRGEGFPNGKTTGRIRIKADQLAAPAALPFTVTRIPNVGWLFCVIIPGLFLGYILRKKGDEDIAFANFQIEARDLDGVLTALLRENADATFVKALTDQQKSLRESYSNRKKLTRAWLDNQQTALTAAKTALQKVKDDFNTRAEKFKAVVRPPYLLHGSLRDAYVKAGLDFERAMQIDRNNYGAADARLTEVEAALRSAVSAEAKRWLDREKENPLLWAALRPLAGDHNVLQSLVKETESAVAVMNPIVAKAEFTLPEITTVLQTIHAAGNRQDALASGFAAVWKRVVGAIDNLSQDRDLTPPDEWIDAADTATAALSSGSVIEAVAVLRGWLEREKAHVQDAAAKAKVEAALSAGNPMDALRAFPESSAANRGAPVSFLLFGVDGEEIESLKVLAGGTLEFDPNASPIVLPVLSLSSEPDPVLRIEQIEEWRRIVALIALAIIGFLILKETYTGQAIDFVVAFFWAFSTDPVLDKATALLSPSLKKISLGL